MLPSGLASAEDWASSLAMSAACGPLPAIAVLSAGVHSASLDLYSAARLGVGAVFVAVVGGLTARSWHSVSFSSAWAMLPLGFARSLAWVSRWATAAACGPLAAIASLIAG